MDASGSMATKMERARETATTLVAGLKPGIDEVGAVRLRHDPSGSAAVFEDVRGTDGAWNATQGYGATSLWDAIAATAQQISDRQRRRALVVITDGVDSASTHEAVGVSAIASALDVPVYMLVITFALEEDGIEAPHSRAAGRSCGVDGRRFAGRSRRASCGGSDPQDS